MLGVPLGRSKKKFTIFSPPCVGDNRHYFGSDDLRGLHLPHDDALELNHTRPPYGRIYCGRLPRLITPSWATYAGRNQGDHFNLPPEDEIPNFDWDRPKFLQRPDTSGQLLKWSIELSEFHIEYKPRTAIKAHALADFIVESTYEDTPQPETTPLEEEIPNEPAQALAHWILFVDGSSNQHGCGAGLVIRAPSGEQMEYAIRMGFKATNNEAEYEALLAGLRITTELGAQSLEVFSDSQLVVNQVQGDYLAKDARMIAYLGEVKAVSAKIKEFKIHQIPREDNKKADALANLASTFEFISDRCIPLEFLTSPSIVIANQVLQTEENPTWLDEIIAYLREGILPRINSKLAASNTDPRDFAFSRAGFTRAVSSHRDGTNVQPLAIRPVGIDILGPLPQAPLQRKFLIVAIDYFTKWIEAQPLAKITEKNTRDFVWKHLVCRFGVPKVIISDNARQFDNDRNLKARLERSKSEWAENLPSILWAYHTTSRIPTGETPYSMVFGTESVIPVEIGMPSFRVLTFDKETNEAELRHNLDLLEERRESAQLRQTAYKCQVAKYYNQELAPFIPSG
ncbi:hypothetical protein Acr_00g0006120 [Actinidia rufa]|uniref:Uncharacterized protein n=1 Tax=Actinidia rufa TaxID=165716 RepID=A0A7J0D9E1_9ERIC|nr:hypothetical protein Acr_00g0006120 [Actinidia rufa]